MTCRHLNVKSVSSAVLYVNCFDAAHISRFPFLLLFRLYIYYQCHHHPLSMFATTSVRTAHRTYHVTLYHPPSISSFPFHLPYYRIVGLYHTIVRILAYQTEAPIEHLTLAPYRNNRDTSYTMNQNHPTR